MISPTSSLRYVSRVHQIDITIQRRLANYLTDLQNAELPRCIHYRTLFWNFCRSMDLPASLYQPENPLGRPDRVPHRWTLRAELGDTAIQVLDQSIHYFRPPCQSSSRQSVLAFPDPAHPSQLHLQQRG